MSLGNALPTEATAASVNSCAILQTEDKEERGERVGKWQLYCNEKWTTYKCQQRFLCAESDGVTNVATDIWSQS